MLGKNENKIKVDLENVAVPEIHINGTAKDEVKEKKPVPNIDYTGAIPEYHPVHKE